MLRRCASRVSVIGPALPVHRFGVVNKGMMRRLPQARSLATGQEGAVGVSRKAVLGAAGAVGILGLGALGHMISENPALGNKFGISTGRIWPEYARQRIRETFTYFGACVGISGGVAGAAYSSGLAMRIMSASPIGFMIGTGVVSIASLITCLMSDKDNSPVRNLAFLAFTASMGLSLAPFGILGGPIVTRALLYTGGIVGGLALVAANSPSDQYLWMAGPLAIGLGFVFVSSLGAAIFPATAAGGLMQRISLYGGLGLFSLYALYDSSRIIHHAEVLPDAQFDPMREGLSIYMDAVNIFIRIAIILSNNSGSQKRK